MCMYICMYVYVRTAKELKRVEEYTSTTVVHERQLHHGVYTYTRLHEF